MMVKRIHRDPYHGWMLWGRMCVPRAMLIPHFTRDMRLLDADGHPYPLPLGMKQPKVDESDSKIEA